MPTPERRLPRPVGEVVRAWSRNPRCAVIFDFNGTLSDDEPILSGIFAELFAARLGWTMTPEHYQAHLLGRSDREIIELVVAERAGGDPHLTTELLTLRHERYRQIVAEHSPITAESTALVRRLHRAQVPMAIVTGAQRGDVMAVLDHCDVGLLIDRLVTEEDVEHGKPHPEGFLKGAQLLRRRPEDILVFEDSIPGVLGATRAGMTVIAVAGPGSPKGLSEAASAVVGQLGDELLADVPWIG